MASKHDNVVFPDDDLDDEEEPSSSDNDLDENDEEDEELGEEDINSPSTSSRIPRIATAVIATPVSTIPPVALAVPVASAVTVAAVPLDEPGPDPKRQRIGDAVVEKKPQQFDDSRRMFQRLWTDEDEIELLQGFLDYTTQRGNTISHHHDTAMFYDQIKSKLQLDFNKNQLVEKLRRLKKKFRNVTTKISTGKDVSFKSPHDQATFEISRKIWSNELGKPGVGGVEDNVLDDDEANVNNATLSEDFGDKRTPKSRKKSRSKPGVKIEEKRVMNDGFFVRNSNNNGNVDSVAAGSGVLSGGGNLASLIEGTVSGCLSPLFKGSLSSATGGSYGMRGYGELPFNAMPLHFGGELNLGGRGSGGELVDERWRKQQILELEVYSKRLELVQDQIKTALDELRSIGG
ncbi:hypothetical protein SLE2022_129050 [Rubroshorea leprosula]